MKIEIILNSKEFKNAQKRISANQNRSRRVRIR